MLPEEVTIIRPVRISFWREVRELLRYRELGLFLIWRDLKIRYKQTILGIGWALLQPFLQMVVFTVFFGRLVKVLQMGCLIRCSCMPDYLPGRFCQCRQCLQLFRD
jgi:hypothetical protein